MKTHLSPSLLSLPFPSSIPLHILHDSLRLAQPIATMHVPNNLHIPQRGQALQRLDVVRVRQ